jgi:beta-N-acetylhexosaminidase
VAGGIVQRAEAALHAGADMVLVCNKPDLADELLAGLNWDMPATSKARLAQMHGKHHPKTLAQLHEDATFIKDLQDISKIGVSAGVLPLV